MSKKSKKPIVYRAEDVCPPFDIDKAIEELELKRRLYNATRGTHSTKLLGEKE